MVEGLCEISRYFMCASCACINHQSIISHDLSANEIFSFFSYSSITLCFINLSSWRTNKWSRHPRKGQNRSCNRFIWAIANFHIGHKKWLISRFCLANNKTIHFIIGSPNSSSDSSVCDELGAQFCFSHRRINMFLSLSSAPSDEIMPFNPDSGRFFKQKN